MNLFRVGRTLAGRFWQAKNIKNAIKGEIGKIFV
jgi:hypothetical protein